MENPNLIEFYGKECPHCLKMRKIVSKFEKKHKTTLTKIEVWHDKANDKKMRAILVFKKCGGVPFFYNKDNEKFICGEAGLRELEAWAK